MHCDLFGRADGSERGSLTMSSSQNESLQSNDKMSLKNDYEGKFNTLRIISLKAIDEFEALQKKCEENYAKYLEERENYSRTKKELDILKEVSGEALGEYENLHRKYQIEQDCRDKAEEFAKLQVKENKQLKRQSAILLNTLAAKVVDFDLEELAKGTESDNSSIADDHGLYDKQIQGLQEKVESLQIRTKELTEKLNDTEEQLIIERKEHSKAREELENNRSNFKQLKQVSVLALEDYSNLQRKYEVEIHCRAEAEKLAAQENEKADDVCGDSVANREHEAIMKQNKVISKDVSGEARLKNALDEVANLTKKLHDQKTEFDEKVKALEEELASSNDVQKLKSLEVKMNTFVQGMETLETRLKSAQSRASEAEAKAKKFEELLKKSQEIPEPPPAPPLPPPPPPPPAPAQLLRKFVGMVSPGGKKHLKKSSSAVKEDPRAKAMSEMMDRIKSGKVELRKTERPVSSRDNADGSAMANLKDVLKTLKRSPSKEENVVVDTNEPRHNTFGVQLRKTERKARSLSDNDAFEENFQTVTLRRPRSNTTGDMLNDDDDNDNKESTMDKDLLKLLKKQKAAAERGEKQGKETDSKIEETQKKREGKRSQSEETESQSEETESQSKKTESQSEEQQPSEETDSKGEQTGSKDELTQNKSEETQSKIDGTQNKSEETQSKIDGTQSKSEEAEIKQ